MAQKAPMPAKIPTSSSQLAAAGPARPARGRAGRSARSPVLGAEPGGRPRGVMTVVMELECGVTVYPAQVAGDRWRAVWREGGRRRQCEWVSEDGLAGRLEPVIERLSADAPNLERPGADLVRGHQDRQLLACAGKVDHLQQLVPDAGVRADPMPFAAVRCGSLA